MLRFSKKVCVMKQLLLSSRSLAVPSLIIALIILPFALFGGAFENFSLSQIDQLAGAGMIVLTVALLAADVLLPVPSSIISLIASNALGIWVGAATIWLGMSLGCVVGTFVGKSLFRPLNNYLNVSEVVAAESDRGYSRTMITLALMRPLPILAESSVMIAASRGARSRDIILITTLANIPVALLYGYFGSVIGKELPLAISFGVLAALTLLALAWKKFAPQKTS